MGCGRTGWTRARGIRTRGKAQVTKLGARGRVGHGKGLTTGARLWWWRQWAGAAAMGARAMDGSGQGPHARSCRDRRLGGAGLWNAGGGGDWSLGQRTDSRANVNGNEVALPF